MEPREDEDRRVKAIIMVCARNHPTVTYTARRGDPPPPCPSCGWTPKPTKE